MIEGAVLRLAVWAPLASLLIFGLCATGLAHLAPVAAIIALVIAARARMPRNSSQSGWTIPLLTCAVCIPFAVVYLANAAAPEISPDGAGYHLGYVRRMWNHCGFYGLTTDFRANFPQGLEMLFLAAWPFARQSGGALVHLLFLLAVPAALLEYGRRFDRPVAGAFAAVATFVAPVAGIDGSSAYVDVALAFSGLASFYLLELWDTDRSNGWLAVCAGCSAGFCFGIKYTGAVAILYAVGYVALRRWKSLPAVIIPAAITGIPWLIKNWMIVGNPVSPFLNRLFPNPYVSAAFEDSFRDAMRHWGGVEIGWTSPIELAIRGGALQGTLGPVLLLSPLALAALRDARGRRVLVAAVLFALPWFSNTGTRFLIPALPFITLGIGMALEKRPRMALGIAGLNALLCWPWVMPLYCDPYAWRITRCPILVTDRLAWVEQNAPEVRYAWLIEEHVPTGGVVYTAQPIMEAYTDRTVLLNYTSTQNLRIESVLKAALAHPGSRREAIEDIRRLGVTHLLIHDLEALGPAISSNPGVWGLTPVGSSGPLRLYEVVAAQ